MDTLITIGKVILTIVEVVLLFNLMIVVHELGHYWAALWRGLKVDRFQIWFGKPIWKKEINGVQWGLGWLPFGGFVALPQMAPMEAIEGGDKEAREALPSVTPLDKIIVAVAGPIFSVLLAVVLAVIVWQVGTPVYERESETLIGGVVEEFQLNGEDYQWEGAEKLNVGDRIVAVNEIPITAWYGANNSVTSEIAFSEGPTVDLTVVRRDTGAEETVTVPVPEKQTAGIFSRSGVRDLPIFGAARPLVSSIVKDSPAARGGIKLGDTILSIDGEKVTYNYEITEVVDSKEGQEIPIVVSRNIDGVDVETTVNVTPLKPIDGERIMLGVGWGGGERVIEYPTVGHQIKDSALAIFRMFGALFSSKSEIGVKDMSGPLMIGKAFYVMFSDDGWQKALWFAVLINVNLAILNMMPLPVLDGGHIVLAIGEWIRKKPVSGRILEVVQTAFALALLSLMAYVTILDGRSMFGGGGGGGGELKFPPAPEVRSAE